MVFGAGQEVFSYEAIDSKEQLEKEASKFIGEPIKVIWDDGRIYSGIFASITKRLSEYAVTIITTSNEMTHKEYFLFKNNWSHISVRLGVKKLIIGQDLSFTSEGSRNLIRNLFAVLPL